MTKSLFYSLQFCALFRKETEKEFIFVQTHSADVATAGTNKTTQVVRVVLFNPLEVVHRTGDNELTPLSKITLMTVLEEESVPVNIGTGSLVGHMTVT